MDFLFRPRSIAVIGATSKSGSLGSWVLQNILDQKFNGTVFPVNHNLEALQSMKVYRSVKDIPGDVDLAVLIIPKSSVAGVAEECGQKGVKGLVVHSAGFREAGEEGRKAEEKLISILQKYRMRCVGPNSMGIINGDPEVNLNESFARTKPSTGNVGFITQSGALGDSLIDFARDLNIGFSICIDIGNKADISENDVLEYLGTDRRTEVISIYLESFHSVGRFAEIAGRIAPKKPIVAIKPGRTEKAAEAIMSHTGAIAGTDAATDALFDRCGIMRVNTAGQLFEVTQVLATQPVPDEGRVAVITNAGGPGILAADAIISCGMQMARLGGPTIRRMEGNVKPESSLLNPIDLIATATPGEYSTAIKAVLEDANVDMLVVICFPIAVRDEVEMAEAIVDAWKPYREKKALAVCMMVRRQEARKAIERFHEHGVPVYDYPESASLAMSYLAKYTRIRKRLAVEVKSVRLSANVSEGERIISASLRTRSDAMLSSADAFKLLEAYGIPIVEAANVTSRQDALKAGAGIGYPVVLKVAVPDLQHKTDLDGVILDIRNGEELLQACDKLHEIMLQHSRNKPSFTVQKMLKNGREVIIGVSRDPIFGPVIMCGLGGIFSDIIHDVSFRLPPLSDLDAQRMLESLKGYRLLTGMRGEQSVDIELLKQVILRVSNMAVNHPELVELDLNPLFIAPKGIPSQVVDARIRVARA